MKIIQLINRTDASKKYGISLGTISRWIRDRVQGKRITKVYKCPNKNCKTIGISPEDLETNNNQC